MENYPQINFKNIIIVLNIMQWEYMDATIENLDSTNYTGDFIGDILTRVNFIGGVIYQK